jgi:NADH-quinone oxidoreductase subunit L
VALGVVALAQKDLKQLLAASTSAQLGFVVMGAGVGALGGGAAQLIGHAATKALLFLAAGAWLTAVGTKQLSGLHGVARRWTVLGWSVAVGLLALAGVPPLSLWATKDEVLAGALEVSPWLYAVGLTGAVLSAAYAAKVLLVVWRGEGTRRDEEQEEVSEGVLEREPTGEVGRAAQAPIAVLAVGAAVLGLLALPPLAEPFARAVGEADPVTATAWELALSGVLAVSVVAATLRWGVVRLPAPVRAWAGMWLGLEAMATRLLVRPTEALARALAWFDDAVLDRAVGATAHATVVLAGAAARLDDSVVDGAVEGAAARVRRLARLARRPQTGQLHQYYVQAVALVAAAVVLLVVVR